MASRSSSRMHSSIYGSAIPRPAAQRGSSTTPSVAPFANVTSSRLAADERIRQERQRLQEQKQRQRSARIPQTAGRSFPLDAPRPATAMHMRQHAPEGFPPKASVAAYGMADRPARGWMPVRPSTAKPVVITGGGSQPEQASAQQQETGESGLPAGMQAAEEVMGRGQSAEEVMVSTTLSTSAPALQAGIRGFEAPPPPMPANEAVAGAVMQPGREAVVAPNVVMAKNLGKGVFASVRLTNRPDGKPVAIKTYEHKDAKERAVYEHMVNEERLAGKLQHEHIIAPQVVHRRRGKTELEMEYAPGGNLNEYLKRQGKSGLPEAEARRLFAQVVSQGVHHTPRYITTPHPTTLRHIIPPRPAPPHTAPPRITPHRPAPPQRFACGTPPLEAFGHDQAVRLMDSTSPTLKSQPYFWPEPRPQPHPEPQPQPSESQAS